MLSYEVFFVFLQKKEQKAKTNKILYTDSLTPFKQFDHILACQILHQQRDVSVVPFLDVTLRIQRVFMK